MSKSEVQPMPSTFGGCDCSLGLTRCDCVVLSYTPAPQIAAAARAGQFRFLLLLCLLSWAVIGLIGWALW